MKFIILGIERKINFRFDSVVKASYKDIHVQANNYADCVAQIEAILIERLLS